MLAMTTKNPAPLQCLPCSMSGRRSAGWVELNYHFGS
jgi:hypothetical protein